MVPYLDLACKYPILRELRCITLLILSVLTNNTEPRFGQYAHFITFVVNPEYRNQSKKQDENKLKFQVK